MHRIRASLATALSLQGIVGSAGDFSCEEVVVISQREKKMFVNPLSDSSGLPMRVLLQSTSDGEDTPVFSLVSAYFVHSLDPRYRDRAPTYISYIGDPSPYCPQWTATRPRFFLHSSLPD